MKRLIILLSFFYLVKVHSQSISIIPQPVKIEKQKGNFILSDQTVIVAGDSNTNSAIQFLNNYLKSHYGFNLKKVKKATKNYIQFNLDITVKKAKNDNQYELEITPQKINIESSSPSGIFYAIQTLIQLLPVSKENLSINSLTITCCEIEDYPRFSYRGMHLDVSRHFFPISYIKKYIDYIALHKMNYFHWHLTDDQGWRIEIKKYPKLTEIGAWRKGTIIGRFPGKGNDNKKHGGYYTQEEIKEIVQYAAERFITVVPEIEMPGHSMAVLAAYPELSTTPAIQPDVPMTWGLNGVENNVFAPSEKSFTFLENVLTEVMSLFPGNMIHIGGDECSKIWWKQDSLSQKLMREKGLKNEDELQSYFIQRIEKFVNSHGKTIIGWDEILEGGLAPNAAVMSWTGEQGGIHAAKEKHNVVMTPGGWCYFDHSQTKNEDSVTIGSYLPLEKVYGYEPIPASLTKDEAKYILGAQGNVWTEYMAYPSKIEYMIFPRMSALSEVLWSPKELRNWENFKSKLHTQLKRYELWKANYSKAYFDLQTFIIPNENNEGVSLKLSSNQKNAAIYYSANTSENIQYSMPVMIKKNTSIQSFQKIENEIFSPINLNFNINKATGKKISSNIAPSGSYPGNGGLFSIINGVKSEKGFNSSEWCGWVAKDVTITIDLGNETEIHQIAINILDQKSSWIHPPNIQGISISNDGLNFVEINDGNTFNRLKDNLIRTIEYSFSERKAKFLKIKLSSQSKIAEGFPGAGKAAWMFVDEIEVN